MTPEEHERLRRYLLRGRILDALEAAWDRNPDLELYELLVYACDESYHCEPGDLTDRGLLEALEVWCR